LFYCAATPLTLAVPDDSILPYLTCRPLRLFVPRLISHSERSDKNYQTEPRLDDFVYTNFFKKQIKLFYCAATPLTLAVPDESIFRNSHIII